MKYANIVYNSSLKNNLGDTILTMAMDNIYRKMGIPEEDIIILSVHELSEYNGEYIVLPINTISINYFEGGVEGYLSPKIIPVFLNYLRKNTYLKENEVSYLNRYAPIGCRDEYTMELLRKYGIAAYLNGCITVTYPLRSENAVGNKVFLVDIEQELLEYIPKEILLNSEVMEQHVEGNLSNLKEITKERYDRFLNEASLVITSRLHVAIPCVAAGIPVVFAKNEISTRFSWVEKICDIYNRSEYEKINWSPNVTEFEELKKQVEINVITRLTDAMNKNKTAYQISAFYEDRIKQNYILDGFTSIKEQVDIKWNKDESFKYSVFCATNSADNLVSYISENYPNALFEDIYDNKRSILFKGKYTKKSDSIIPYSDNVIFVCANVAATNELIKQQIKEIGYNEDNIVLIQVDSIAK